jgi:hypothetical protein
MKLRHDWWTVLCKAWSVRFMLLAALFDGAAGVWFIFAETMPAPAFALIGMAINLAAVVARIFQQKDIP